jgi:hypothetical protein
MSDDPVLSRCERGTEVARIELVGVEAAFDPSVDITVHDERADVAQ